LYFICRNSNNLELKRHYQIYCKILSNVIKEAKRIYYDKKIQKAGNKCKTTSDIIKKLTNNLHSHTDIQELMMGSKHLKNQQYIADTFSNYFATIIDKISKNNVNNKTNNERGPR
jgi:predicted nucleic acid-binding protein